MLAEPHHQYSSSNTSYNLGASALNNVASPQNVYYETGQSHTPLTGDHITPNSASGVQMQQLFMKRGSGTDITHAFSGGHLSSIS